MNVTPFPGATSVPVPVAVLVGASIPPINGPQRLAMAAGVFDLEGQPVAVNMQTIEVSAGRRSDDIDGLSARFDLPPGRYEVRAAVRDEGTRAVGSVFSFLDVPDAGADALGLSGLVFRRESSPAPQRSGAFDGLIPFVPTVDRQFTQADSIGVFARVYSRAGVEPVSVRAPRGRVRTAAVAWRRLWRNHGRPLRRIEGPTTVLGVF